MLIRKERERHHVLIKDLYTFIYDHILHSRKPFCGYCLQAFSTKEILIRHIKHCFKINGKLKILMPKKREYINKYTNKYQTHIACSNGYKLVCVDDKFDKFFKTYLGKDAVYNFINNMVEKSK